MGPWASYSIKASSNAYPEVMLVSYRERVISLWYFVERHDDVIGLSSGPMDLCFLAPFAPIPETMSASNRQHSSKSLEAESLAEGGYRSGVECHFWICSGRSPAFSFHNSSQTRRCSLFIKKPCHELEANMYTKRSAGDTNSWTRIGGEPCLPDHPRRNGGCRFVKTSNWACSIT